MEIVQFTDLIGSLGFPVACVCAMFYMWNKERESHKEEADRMTEALQQNTLVITELKTLIKNYVTKE